MAAKMTKRPLYREIASMLTAIDNCRKAGNQEWLEKHEATLKHLVDRLPSGGGIDIGPKLDRDACKLDRLVFTFSYHHMNENGMYDGWTDHVLTVRPSFDGIDLRISGRDRNQVKDYLYETFQYALTMDIDIN